MNAVITRSCNRTCEFCFASNPGGPVMPRAMVRQLGRALRAEGRDVVPLVGGEPTLHPEFGGIVEDLAADGMGVRVFTHGQIGQAALDSLVARDPAHCRVVVNASASLGDDGRLAAGVLRSLAALGPRASLALTIDRVDRPYREVLALYQRYSLRGLLRIGLAQPTLAGDNHALDYRAPGLGRLVTELCIAAKVRDIEPQFDCGFVLCTFTPAQLAVLDRLHVPVRSVCGAIADVGPDGQAWPCFPLGSAYATPVDRHDSLAGVRAHLDRRLRGFRAAGLYPECQSCAHFHAGRCMGGCLARVIPTFSRAPEACP